MGGHLWTQTTHFTDGTDVPQRPGCVSCARYKLVSYLFLITLTCNDLFMAKLSKDFKGIIQAGSSRALAT